MYIVAMAGVRFPWALLAFWAASAVVTSGVPRDNTLYFRADAADQCPSPDVVCNQTIEAVDSCDGRYVRRRYVTEGGIRCTLQGECLNTTLSRLHPDVTRLQLVIDTFPSSGVSFSRFVALRRLELLWQSSADDLLHTNESSLTDPNLFAGLTSLESLSINVPVINMSSTLLLELTNLRDLDLTNIGYFSTAQFASLYKGSRLEEKPLKCLILKRMSGVDTGVDRQFRMDELLPLFNESHLKAIDVSDNGELYLTPGLTNALPYLSDLRASGNMIRYIHHPNEASCFIAEGGLHQNVRYLDISNLAPMGEAIDYLGQSFVAKAAPCVSKQRFSNNTCICDTFREVCGRFLPNRTIPCTHFREFAQSDWINCTPVEKDPPRTCENCFLFPLPTSLEAFHISNTQFNFKFKHFGNRTDCFATNKMTSLDLSFITFHLARDSYRIVGWDALENLNLSHSDWGFFFHDPKFLMHMTNITILDMTATKIGTYIKNDTRNDVFSHSGKLKQLYLAAAGLTYIPYAEFSVLINLELLDLSYNRLTNISFDVSNLTSLTILDLSHNAFYQLPEVIMNNLNALSLESLNGTLNVNLLSNDFICDCHSLTFIQWLRNPTGIVLTDVDEYLCNYHGLGKVHLAGIDMHGLIVTCYSAYITVVSVGIAAIAIIITTVITYTQRWKLRTLLLKLAHLCRGDDDDEECTYDGFVVYANDDRHWVHKTLLPRVEEDMGLKLCIHHRDFIPGHDIDDQIVGSIDASKKTLVILSNDFFESNWCYYEYMTARNKLQAEGKDVIIPILLTELPDESLKKNHSIKNLLREKTYLEWETSLAGQKYFWKKLELAIKSKRKKREVGSDIPLLDTTPTPPVEPAYHAMPI